MGKLFGTNGIRGVFPDTLSLQFIHDITLSIATYFGKGPILVGYDGRVSSPPIAKLVCSTLNEAGLDCANAGLVPTPALEFATKKLRYAGGIMITASHNPPEYNGLKPVAADGVEIPREDESVIEEIYFGKKWIRPARKLGKTRQESRVADTYIAGIKSHINTKKIRQKKFKIILDLGNGAQAVAAPRLCEELGCKTYLVNQKIDGNFPGRGSEPTPQNLQKLSSEVIRKKADLGVAFDGDGDRSLFCDENGTILTGDRSALLLASHILQKNPHSKLVTCLNSSSVTEQIAQNAKAQVIRTKVGSVEVSRTMVPQKALIGFEENGGFMYGRHNAVRDGCMTLGLLLDLLAETGNTLSAALDLVPKSYTTKDKIRCTPQQAKKLIDSLKKQHKNYDDRDGIKITLGKKIWVMVRPSGTEPIARIYAEADSQEKLDDLMREYLAKAKTLLR
ncbi:MAG TPA: phosphoglucosamine mutase [Candidatus Nitrosotenuis sp.]|nr:phosphoglucosamine mutase [Candidatus Nitrosotenuis sp.]